VSIKWMSGAFQYAITTIFIIVSLMILMLYFFIYAISGPEIIKYGNLIVLLITTPYFITLIILFSKIDKDSLINSEILRFNRNRITLVDVYDNIEVFLKSKNIKYDLYSPTNSGLQLVKPIKIINLPNLQTKIYILKDSLHINSKDAVRREEVKRFIEEFVNEIKGAP